MFSSDITNLAFYLRNFQLKHIILGHLGHQLSQFDFILPLAKFLPFITEDFLYFYPLGDAFSDASNFDDHFAGYERYDSS